MLVYHVCVCLGTKINAITIQKEKKNVIIRVQQVNSVLTQDIAVEDLLARKREENIHIEFSISKNCNSIWASVYGAGKFGQMTTTTTMTLRSRRTYQS